MYKLKRGALGFVVILSLSAFIGLAEPFSVAVVYAESPTAAENGEFVPPTDRPSDATVLFDSDGTCDFVSKQGTAIDWPIIDGALVSTAKDVRSNHIVSKTLFQDADIHVEFCMAEQANGNSGVYIHGLYEVQIINSADTREPTNQDCGALYGMAAPLVNAAKKPGEWQTYDIRYTAPRRDKDGAYVAEGKITAWLNGQKILDNVSFTKPYSQYHPFRYKSTDYLQKVYQNMEQTGQGPLFLQDHDSPCRYRNVWIRVR